MRRTPRLQVDLENSADVVSKTQDVDDDVTRRHSEDESETGEPLSSNAHDVISRSIQNVIEKRLKQKHQKRNSVVRRQDFLENEDISYTNQQDCEHYTPAPPGQSSAQFSLEGEPVPLKEQIYSSLHLRTINERGETDLRPSNVTNSIRILSLGSDPG